MKPSAQRITQAARFARVVRPPRLPPRNPDAHKGDCGRIAIVAGSCGMSGAAALCGLGALRGGAGLVRVFTPRSVRGLVASFDPSLMCAGVEEDGEGRVSNLALPYLVEALKWADVVAMGPGLGRGGAVQAVVRQLLESAGQPVVLDADGLNAAAESGTWWQARRGATVITPHPGEMERLRRGAELTPVRAWSAESRQAAAIEMARLTGAVVLLKGRGTVVTDGRRAYVNRTGNPGMASGGMGDVLAGLIAALIGQGLSPFEAACLGAHAHGAAADRLAKRIGPRGYLAREVADQLPAVLR